MTGIRSDSIGGRIDSGASQLECQIQFVPDRDAVLTHGRDRGLICSCCIYSSRPQRLQSKATPLVTPSPWSTRHFASSTIRRTGRLLASLCR